MALSLQITNYFGKQHEDVLRTINYLDFNKDFKEYNFESSLYIRELYSRVQYKYPLYCITRGDFTFLAMGFTGKIASKFK